MLKPLQRPVCHSSSGLYAEQDLTEQHLPTMDVKLVTLVAALMVVLYAPPSQGMQLYPCVCAFLCLFACLWLFSLYNFGKMVQNGLQGFLKLSEISLK